MIKKRFTLLSTLLVAFSCWSYAQLPAIQWQKSMGGSQEEYDGNRETGIKTIKTADKGYLLLGATYSSDGDVSVNYGAHDLWISKFNDKGTLQWEKSFGGTAFDWADDVRQTSDGGYIICGTTTSGNGVFAQRPGGFSDFWVLKLSPDGELEWQKFYGGSGDDYGMSLVESDGGGYVVCGRSGSNDQQVSGNHGGLDLWLLRIDPTGNLLWQKCFGGGYNEFGGLLEKTSDGNYIIGGFQAQTGSNNILTADFEAYVLKVDTNGNEIWHKTYGGSYYEDIKRIIPTTDGGYIFAGTTKSNDKDVAGNHPNAIEQNGYHFDEWIVKLDAVGNITWQIPLGGSSWDYAFDIAELSDSYIVCGRVNSNDGNVSGNHGIIDGWLTKLSKSGVLIDQKCYGGSSVDILTSIQVLNDNEYIVAGQNNYTNGDVEPNHGGTDLWLMKLSNKPFEFNTIKGIVYKDDNGNGIMDGAEALFDNKNILIKNNAGFTQPFKNTGLGAFEVKVDTGKYIITVPNNDVSYRIVPRSVVSVFPTYGNTNDLRFGLIPSALVSDITVYADALAPVRAGLTAKYTISYSYQGTRPVLSAKIKVLKDPRLSYSSSGLPLVATLGDTLVFVVNNLQPQIGSSFNLELSVPAVPLVNIGDSLSLHYNIIPMTADSSWFEEWGLLKQAVLKPVNNIKGYAYVDYNSNNIQDNDEPVFYDGIVVTEKRDSTIATYLDFGEFNIETDTGKYMTKFQLPYPYYQVTPASKLSDFSTYGNVDSFDFALRPIAGIRDLQVNVAPLYNAKPGTTVPYAIFYANKGTDTVMTGSIRFVKSARTTFAHADIAPDLIDHDTLTWNYSTLYPLENRMIYVELVVDVPPVVNLGDSLAFSAQISPVEGDSLPGDNRFDLYQVVVNSFDPNDKMEAHGGKLQHTKLLDGDNLTYVIRFQNTGNATAADVIVRDTLDAKLDWNSLQMISASHHFRLTITQQHELTWQFANINLPDSNVDEPGSHGYIIYCIKPKASLLPGDTIHNTAAIYFDYNLPIFTNNAKTAITSLSTLPVDLLSFKAVLNDGTVNVTWKTATESNADLFEVQRSANGKDFITIGTVQAKNVATGASYAFKDEAPAAGYNYYRLKTVDINRSSKLSSIVMVNVKAGADLVASIYPNPTGGEVTVDIKGDNVNDVNVSVIDHAGRVVLTRLIARQSGNRTMVPLSLGRLSKGLYTLRVTAGKHTSTHQLLVR